MHHFYLVQVQTDSIAGSDAPQTSMGPPGAEEKSIVSEPEFPVIPEDTDISGIQFDQSMEEGGDISGIKLSLDTTGLTERKRQSITVGGLDDEENVSEEKPTPKRSRQVGPKRMRKRRRIVIDNDNTELSNDHIKSMLRDTSDIVIQNRTHPADYTRSEIDKLDDNLLTPSQRREFRTHLQGDDPTLMIISELPYESLLTRPNISDDGALAPDLLALWTQNASRLQGKPFPFRMRGEAAKQEQLEREEREKEKLSRSQASDEEDDIEIGRNDQSNEETPTRLSLDITNQEFPEMDESSDQVNVEDDFIQPPDFEEPSAVLDYSGIGFGGDMAGMASPARSETSNQSEFSLGAVNDMEADFDQNETTDSADAPRQEQGDELVSSKGKWHKHTVKVLSMLKRNMAEANKKGEVNLSYNKLSHGCSRRTASGVFFEILQLKTWDFVDVDQEESYADIKISRGARFAEEPSS